jgi:hypothetical protein
MPSTVLRLSRKCNREPGHSTRPWTNPCQAQGRRNFSFPTWGRSPGVLKILWSNTGFYSRFSHTKRAGLSAQVGRAVSFENSLTRFKSNLNKGVVGIKWSILITLEESSILHDGTFKLSRDSNLATALKG